MISVASSSLSEQTCSSSFYHLPLKTPLWSRLGTVVVIQLKLHLREERRDDGGQSPPSELGTGSGPSRNSGCRGALGPTGAAGCAANLRPAGERLSCILPLLV